VTCSLVITTYNWKEALELVLKSVLIQTQLPDEIIIADDGSTNDTKILIQSFAKTSPIPIVHSWQEDDGFRAAMSRNKAIAKATSEYIILIDGDMILHKEFIRDHVKNAQKSYFIQGSRVLITQTKANQLFERQQIHLSVFEKGIKNRKNSIHSNCLSNLFSSISHSLKGIKTCNMSFFKSDCIAINGFNEDFEGWGREDSEFVVRLFNNNIERKNIKFNCIAYHIWHNENARTSLTRNDFLLQNSILNHLKRCDNGLNKYLENTL
jgi:glycosyltransferase involved in cell wall biosynthesis